MPVAILEVLIFSVVVVLFIAVNDEVPKFRGRRMVKKAKAYAKAKGPILVTNTVKGITAVCRYEDYAEAERVWLERPISAVDEKQRVEFLTQKKELLVEPTFTFYKDEESYIMAHTGHIVHLGTLCEELVLYVTGFKQGKVDFKSYSSALSELVVTRSQLLIPFMRPVLAGLSLEEQVKKFRFECADDAFTALLPKEMK